MVLPSNPLDPNFQGHQITRKWPLASAALRETYFQNPDWSRTVAGRYNFAGYMMRALDAFRQRAIDLYPDNPPYHEQLDRAAAREIRFQWKRNRPMRNPPAFLYRCLWNLPYERPERIQEANQSQLDRAAFDPARKMAPRLQGIANGKGEPNG